tara:strand:- start:2103 stop:2975 length:873 start_codon:yes stop_codon:yes gene_type:complete
MSRASTIDCPKVLCSPLDTSKATFSGVGINPGTLVNSGVSFFGGTLNLGVAKAAVNIGPPIAIPGLTLPFSLWVDGVSVFVGVTNFVGARYSFAFVQNLGFHQNNGAAQQNGAKLTNAFKCDNAIQVKNGLSTKSANSSFPLGLGFLFTGRSLGNKSFDIEHPNKDGWRLRHVCVEGPESAVYIRGRLTGKNMIELPEYWNGLVDYDSITVQLQPIGDRHFHLNVMEIDKEKVVVKEADDKPIDCFYHVWANRLGPELHVEYEGKSPADYPGDQSQFSIAGYDYDRREER